MRASELIGRGVVDARGAGIGRVHDLSFEMSGGDGTPLRFRLTGLGCQDSIGIGHRLGYGIGDMAGPWPLDRWFSRRHQRTSLQVDWADVAHVHADRIVLRSSHADLQSRDQS